jgi:hypothetical protein
VLTNLEMRNGITNTTRRWTNKTVPFVIADVFSEYCSTNLQSGFRFSQDGRQMEASYVTELQWVGQDIRDTVACEVVHWVEVVKDRG